MAVTLKQEASKLDKYTLNIGPVVLEVEASSEDEARDLMMKHVAESREKITAAVDGMERQCKNMEEAE